MNEWPCEGRGSSEQPKLYKDKEELEALQLGVVLNAGNLRPPKFGSLGTPRNPGCLTFLIFLNSEEDLHNI